VVTTDDAVDEDADPISAGAVEGPSSRATSVPSWLDWGVSVWLVQSGNRNDRMNKSSPMRKIIAVIIRQTTAKARAATAVAAPARAIARQMLALEYVNAGAQGALASLTS
jgi:hypothetical protein